MNIRLSAGSALFCLLTALGLTNFLGPALRAAEVQPLRALLVTGGCCHEYGNQKDILKKGLETRLNVVIAQVHTNDTTDRARLALYEKADWAKDLDVVIHDECSSYVTDKAFVQNILNAHRNGLPAVNLHCAMHSYRIDSDEWFQFTGIQSAAHGPHEPIAIQFLDAEHPLTKGLTDWTTIREELYNNLKVFPTAHPLARGRQFVKQPDGTSKEMGYFVAWVNQYGKTRVFSTTLGHNTATVSDPRYLDLVARGLLWACGKLDADGKPLPGYRR
jgi:type 1 glutamine amidotransferase